MNGGRIHAWLLAAFLLLALAPLLGGGWYFLHIYENALRETVANNLVQITNKKYDQIDRFFQERYNDITLLATRTSVQNAILELSQLWQAQGPHSPSYQRLNDSLDKSMLSFLESGDYYDLLLIDTGGNVLYSVAREADFATNLFSGPYRDTHFAEDVETALNLLQTGQTIFAPYAPSQDKEASFLISPVLHDGKPIGVVALQFNWDRLASVATDRTGLGTSGETVLAQKDGDFVLYTSPLQHIENAAFRYRIPFAEVAVPMKHALSGQSGYSVMIADYTRQSTVSAWRYLPALRWGMVVKIDTDEALAPLRRMQQLTVAVLFVLTCAISLLAIYFSRIMTKPLINLIAATQQMTRKNFNIKATPTGPRELRELAAAFNQMSARLAELYTGLEIKVRERDNEILARKQAEADLIEARDAAEAANRAKSVFLANMSHELRTPLNAILGFAQILRRDPSLTDEQHSKLETINRSGSHLLALINDVLEISRIEAGRTEVQNEVFSLTEMLTSAEDMIRLRAESKGLHFASLRDGELPRYVVGDAHHLRQILLNLLSNAVKYTAQGSVRLHVQAEGDNIRFEVSDTGAGIAEADLPRIFQAFYQTEKGAAQGEGTGLGLTISREFVRLMGGTIDVSSEPGKGSTFVFTVPLPEAEAPALSAPPCQVIGLAPDQPTVRVLVAEDNNDNRELIRLLLSNIGFGVKTVENGQQAVDCFQTWRPWFIWMDMRMPVMNGYEATKAIRALPGGNKVKIAALTASAFREDKDGILAAGCDDMLAKPVDEQKLLKVMGDQLGLRYRYADEVSGNASELPRSNGALDLSTLSPELRAELAEAAELLDAEKIKAILAHLQPEHPEIAKAIRIWTEVYRFDLVAKLCRNGQAQPE